MKNIRQLNAFVLSFLALFFTDFAWSAYIGSVKAGAAFEAACWALALFVLGAFAVVSYTKNHWLIVPAALGAFAGTYVGVWVQ